MLSNLLRVFRVNNVVRCLVWLDLGERVDRCPRNAAGIFIVGPSHFGIGCLWLIVRIFCPHHRRRIFLSLPKSTNPSSRTMRLLVSHLGLRSNLGRARWKELPSKVVMAYSLGRGCIILAKLAWRGFRGRAAEGRVAPPSNFPWGNACCNRRRPAERRPCPIKLIFNNNICFIIASNYPENHSFYSRHGKDLLLFDKWLRILY